MKRRKNDLITLTRNELDAMMETEMHDRLSLKRHKYSRQHKLYNILNEDYGSDDYYHNSEDDYSLKSSDESEYNYGSDDYYDESEDDYGSEIGFEDDYCSENDYNDSDKCYTTKKLSPSNIDRKVTNLINIYKDEIEDDSDDYGLSREVNYYLNQKYGYNSFDKKVELYNQLKEIIIENL